MGRKEGRKEGSKAKQSKEFEHTGILTQMVYKYVARVVLLKF